ncbi:MAG: transcriptional regulator [Alphaproteobacteria bacterium]|jgi:transcriptional regulator with XRE-family HTH domain|nr:transcriptional regulator [Alphaproteobacteria bacterium]|tara:strand:- start:1981 stop:2340 length:360 start_codon:yes stop_codon:yes gene_type:complete
MTPFGDKVRALRAERGLTLKAMAADLELSPAYLSSLEHGHRGRPTEALVVQICEYFNLIWDDYEEMHRLARVSHPKITVDTSGLTPTHTELANTLAEKIADMSEQDATAMLARLRGDLF